MQWETACPSQDRELARWTTDPVVDPGADPTETIVEAVENCPVGAIKVQDTETGNVLFG